MSKKTSSSSSVTLLTLAVGLFLLPVRNFRTSSIRIPSRVKLPACSLLRVPK